MNCNQCGFIVNEGSRFCSNCGCEIVNEPIISIGYSANINDLAFNKYLNYTTKWSIRFAMIIAVIAVIGFFIYGETSRDMDNPQALFIGMAIGGMFIVIALFQLRGKKNSITWDGQVTDKQTKEKQKRLNGDHDSEWLRYTQYTVIIQSTTGKRHKIVTEDNDFLYNYYQIGDYVRHHKGLNTYEKYDKSNDTIIFCNACSTLNNIQDDYCYRCKCPLLK